VLWVGSVGGMEADLVKRMEIPYTEIPSGQVAGMGLRTLPNLVRVFKGMLASRRILNDFKPDVLLFTGGYVAVPMALAGSGLLGGRKTPSLVYVPDIEPGIALKLLARFATTIALTTEDSRKFFSPEKHTAVTGYPTRPELHDWNHADGRKYLGLEPDRFTLLVTGGSKGARTINQPVFANLAKLVQDIQIVHITGQADWPDAEAAQAKLSATQPEEIALRYHPIPYLHEMGAALAAADLVISRAGASSLGEYPQFGLPAILVPYQYAWRYQKVNADYLVRNGAAVLLEHDQLPDQLLPTVQSLSHDPERLQNMCQAMQSLARPQAAQRLADLVKELAGTARNKEQGQAENTGNREKR